MKALKVLGIIAGAYLAMDFGVGLGVAVTSDYYEGRLDESDPTDKFIIKGIEIWQEVNERFENWKSK